MHEQQQDKHITWPKRTIALLAKLGISHPIILAPMAGVVTAPDLVAAVSNAGGLGFIGAGYMPADKLKLSIQETRATTKYAFGVNLFVPPIAGESQEAKINKIIPFLNVYRKELQLDVLNPKQLIIDTSELFERQLDVILAENIKIFSFTFGIPTPLQIKKLKANNVIIIGLATTVREALALEVAGCDIIVAQGSEAGGHRGSFASSIEHALIGSMALVPQIVDNVDLPVISAGGIMDGRGLVASLALGASAVQMGTAFLTTVESGAYPAYKEAILKSNEESTVITSVVSGKSVRGLENRLIQELNMQIENIPAYPIQHQLTQEIRNTAAKQNRPELMSLWAGQGTRLSKNISANELIEDMLDDARKSLASFS